MPKLCFLLLSEPKDEKQTHRNAQLNQHHILKHTHTVSTTLWQSPSPPLLLIEAELLSRGPPPLPLEWSFNRTGWAKRGSPWGLSCFHSIWPAGYKWKGWAVTRQKQTRRDRNSLRSHRKSLECNAKPTGEKQNTDCILQTANEIIPPPQANTHTHTHTHFQMEHVCEHANTICIT